MIHPVTYKQIPNTNLEISAIGEHSSRTLVIRTVGQIEPMHASTAPRAIYIGRPQREIRQAMRDGHFTRAILKKMGLGIGGGTFTGLQKALDAYLKDLQG